MKAFANRWQPGKDRHFIRESIGKMGKGPGPFSWKQEARRGGEGICARSQITHRCGACAAFWQVPHDRRVGRRVTITDFWRTAWTGKMGRSVAKLARRREARDRTPDGTTASGRLDVDDFSLTGKATRCRCSQSSMTPDKTQLADNERWRFLPLPND